MYNITKRLRHFAAGYGGHPWQLCDEAAFHIAALEAENAKLREALETLLDLLDNTSPFGGELQEDRIERAWHQARAALSAVKEG